MRNTVSLRVLLFAGLASMLASVLPTAAQANLTETWVSGTDNRRPGRQLSAINDRSAAQHEACQGIDFRMCGDRMG
jgi:hypothetical protein